MKFKSFKLNCGEYVLKWEENGKKSEVEEVDDGPIQMFDIGTIRV